MVRGTFVRSVAIGSVALDARQVIARKNRKSMCGLLSEST
jgi:hypothetical protein